MSTDGRCSSCPAIEPAVVSRQHGADVAIVFDSPSERARTRDSLVVGGRGGEVELLRATIAAAGGDLDDYYVCTAVNCAPNSSKKAMLNRCANACRSRLVEELRASGVSKVLCLGPIGFAELLDHERLPAITKVRGRWHHAYGMNVMATLPPRYVLGERNYFPDLSFDIQKFLNTDGPDPDPEVRIIEPSTPAQLRRALQSLRDTSRAISCDLETTGLSPISDGILAAGLAVLDADGIGAEVVIIGLDLIDRGDTWRQLAVMLNDEDLELVFHNAKFDLQFFKTYIEHHGYEYRPSAIHDTMLLHYTLDERPMGRFGSHSLKNLARQYYDAPDYDIHMGRWLKEYLASDESHQSEMRVDMTTYLALDCYYTARLFPDLWNEALEESEGLLDLYETLLMPGSLALAEVEHHGIILDTEMFKSLGESLGRDADALADKLRSATGRPDFNPGSPKQVEEVIYHDLGLPFGVETVDGKVYHTARRGGLQEGPTAAAVLKGLARRYPEHQQLIEDIVAYRNLQKNIGTYVNGLLERVDTDGRIRCSFNLHGTATGRLSSSNPNLQNIPDASHTGVEIRGGFMAPEGYSIVEADYKQLEVRIAAWLSGDPVMREVFESGRDPHQEIAFSIYKKPKEEITHFMRWLAKNILFGLLYGRGHESVATGPEQEDIVERGGQRWTIEDVREFFDTLLAEWSVFAQWQEDQRAAGYRDGYVEMPTGRRKRFGFIPRQDGGYVGRASFNNPIQGTASDFTLSALINLHQDLPEGATIISTVHDAIIFQVRDDLLPTVTEMIRSYMEERTLIQIDVPLKVDIDVSKRWGEKDQHAHEVIADDDEAKEN